MWCRSLRMKGRRQICDDVVRYLLYELDLALPNEPLLSYFGESKVIRATTNVPN